MDMDEDFPPMEPLKIVMAPLRFYNAGDLPMPKPGWMDREAEDVQEKVESFPDWLKDAAGIPKRGRGQPPKENPLRNSVKIRFNDDEYAAIQQAANSTGQTFSQWARQILVREAKK